MSIKQTHIMSVWHTANTQYILPIIIIHAYIIYAYKALQVKGIIIIATTITHVRLFCGNTNQRRKYILEQEEKVSRLYYRNRS